MSEKAEDQASPTSSRPTNALEMDKTAQAAAASEALAQERRRRVQQLSAKGTGGEAAAAEAAARSTEEVAVAMQRIKELHARYGNNSWQVGVAVAKLGLSVKIASKKVSLLLAARKCLRGHLGVQEADLLLAKVCFALSSIKKRAAEHAEATQLMYEAVDSFERVPDGHRMAVRLRSAIFVYRADLLRKTWTTEAAETLVTEMRGFQPSMVEALGEQDPDVVKSSSILAELHDKLRKQQGSTISCPSEPSPLPGTPLTSPKHATAGSQTPSYRTALLTEEDSLSAHSRSPAFLTAEDVSDNDDDDFLSDLR